MDYLTKDILEKKPRSPISHKGEFGRVLVIAGSEDFAGAEILTALSCEAILRVGADLSIACCPERVAWLVNNKLPDAITLKFSGKNFRSDHFDRIKEHLEKSDVLLIGPGLSSDSSDFARKVITSTNKPKVIDAEAISSVSLDETENAVFTPHEKELDKLLTQSKLSKDELQQNLNGNVVLKKGKIDNIISESRTAKNKTGNAFMTKGGTGDVLAGMVAGFIGQGYSLFESACKAAYLNGAVGDYLKEERGKTFIASDIVENIHEIYK